MGEVQNSLVYQSRGGYCPGLFTVTEEVAAEPCLWDEHCSGWSWGEALVPLPELALGTST